MLSTLVSLALKLLLILSSSMDSSTRVVFLMDGGVRTLSISVSFPKHKMEFNIITYRALFVIQKEDCSLFFVLYHCDSLIFYLTKPRKKLAFGFICIKV